MPPEATILSLLLRSLLLGLLLRLAR